MLKPLSVQLYSLRARAEKDFAAVLKDVAAMPDQVETIIVELDYCDIDMNEAIAQSYQFMT